jgi:hypothetical protein
LNPINSVIPHPFLYGKCLATARMVPCR